MNIILIIPYFGKLPAYFEAFVYSCKYLREEINIILITDDSKHKEITYPTNFRTVEMSFQDLQKRASDKGLGLISSPYKLCDYKPCYGLLFEDFTEGFNYWGYCDIDMLFGDIMFFLEKDNYCNYDRIGKYGNFTIYKNNEKNKTLFLTNIEKASFTEKFSNVCKTTYPCYFDESGMNFICNKTISFLESNYAFNSTLGYKHIHTGDKVKVPQILTWEKGKTFSYSLESDGTIQKRESGYIHFQTHKHIKPIKGMSDYMIICNEGILPFSKEKLNEVLLTYGQPDTEKEHLEEVKKQLIIHRKTSIKRLIKELKVYKFTGILNILKRISSYKKYEI